MSKLDDIREYSKALSKASRWHNSKTAIMHIENTKNAKKKEEYIYEFYCVLRILNELRSQYDDISLQNEAVKVVFPKGPASKANFPYFSIKKKANAIEDFQLCYGVEILSVENITCAPDISFQKAGTGLLPKAGDILMIFDSKYKHNPNDSVSRTEFFYVSGLIITLELQNALVNVNGTINLGTLSNLIGNCILSNGFAYNDNVAFHQKHYLKEVEKFDKNVGYTVHG